MAAKTTKVKVLYSNDMMLLEKKVNDFIADVTRELIDIKYSHTAYQDIRSKEISTVCSAMIVYKS